MNKQAKKHFKSIFIFVFLLVATIATLLTRHFSPEIPGNTKEENTNFKVVFIDVGQGDATLLRTPEGETILIDGGEYDEYKTELLPFLKEVGAETIDIALVTHYHSDHMGGIQQLVEDGKVRKLIIPDYPDTDKTRSVLEKTAKKSGTSVECVSAGNFIKTSCEELKIQVIHPPKGGSDGSNFHNNSSMVLKVLYGRTSILITGDIEKRVEKEIAEEYDIECDILQVAHHGSSSSTSMKFLEKADPTYGIISVGKDNSYGHPHAEIVSRLEDDDIRVFRTDQDGDITFIISEEKIEDIKYSK